MFRLYEELTLPCVCRLYEELTGVNDEIGDLEDRLAALKDKADSLGKKYVQAKKDSEKADREVQVISHWPIPCACLLPFVCVAAKPNIGADSIPVVAV